MAFMIMVNNQGLMQHRRVGPCQKTVSHNTYKYDAIAASASHKPWIHLLQKKKKSDDAIDGRPLSSIFTAVTNKTAPNLARLKTASR